MVILKIEKNNVYNMDCLEGMKLMEADSVDCIVTDPPYGYSFLGAVWDQSTPSIDIWKECLRVLKPGAFAFIMSAPRLDVLTQMSARVAEAGFRIDFTPMYWTYLSGFPKSMCISKAIDKRLGAERETTNTIYRHNSNAQHQNRKDGGKYDDCEIPIQSIPATPEAKALDGSYAGFQPKPAVEVIIVAMKPLNEKTYVDQALTNGKGITWLDDCRIPINADENLIRNNDSINSFGHYNKGLMGSNAGRFPANLLVSDDVLDNGTITKSPSGTVNRKARENAVFSGNQCGFKSENLTKAGFGDVGGVSRYFSLDAWYEKKVNDLPKEARSTFPFLIVPKAAKSEKNEGCESFIIIEINTLPCKEKSSTKEENLVRLQVDMEQFPPKVIDAYGIQGNADSAWNTMLFGKEIMEKYRTDYLSIIRMGTKSTTSLKILNWLTHLLTKEYMVDVRSSMENGISHVANAEKYPQLITSIPERMESLLGVNNVASGTPLRISVKDGANIHSTVKPVKLFSYLVTLGSRHGDIILDPFAGSGTIAVASRSIARNFIGFEIEKEYAEIANARAKQVVDQKSLFEF